jgi:ABC-type multidrug transport system fused ATPase/permease subunit
MPAMPAISPTRENSVCTVRIKKYPIGGKPMLVADLPGDHRGLVTPFRDRFLASWKKSGGKTSGALLRWMAPWWLFTHAINAPRKYVQFLPAFLVSNLLDFLENARVPVTVGYKLIALAALRAVCEKTAHLASHLSPNSAGVQPAFIGAKAAIYTKLQTMSPRGRVTISAAEVQTVFSKMDSGKWSWFGGTMDVGLEVASLPLGYYFFYKLFGLPAVLVSITTNFGLTAITAKVMARKTAADKRLRELRKKQEDALNELAGSLPIWKLYGWTGMFIGRLETLTEELQAAGRVAAVWKALGEVLPLCIGPAAVLISVGIDVRLGGKVSLVKLLTAGQYIQIISASMTALQRTVAQWKEFVIEAKSIDDILLLPDAEPLQRSADGTIRLSQASFGWPVKPPQRYEVTAKGDTPCVPAAASKANADAAVASKANADAADAADADADADVDADANANANANGAEATESEGDLVPSTLQAGDVVESVDDQKTDTTVRVRSVGGKHNGYVELSALKKLPPPKHADWAAPKAVVAELDVEITPGELVLVSGPVAGGKSSFLQSLVGNTEQLSGELTVPHSVAFQPQTPILFDQTIRSNILFGVSEEDANEDWIKESLDSSTLSMDMDDSESTLHAKREMTKAGQNGSELSGGQQARVALARCFYAALAGSECVILDDPIKALDPATAARCWESGIKGTLARKTRVLVVNSQMLQRFATDAAVTRLIIVESGAEGVGKIAFNGSPSEMPKSLAERLGDGYNIDFSEQAVAAQLAKDLAAAPESEEKAAVEASPEMLAAAEAVKAKVLTVKTWPDVYQEWFKGCLHKGDDGIKQIAMGVSKDLKEFAGKDDEFKQAVWKMLIKGDFGDLANQQFPEINGPAEEAAKSEDDTKDEEDKPPEPEPKKNYPHTIPGSILDYCKRQGIFVPITCGCSFVSQALALIVYYWNDKWATDAYKLGFRRNYGIAIGLTLASQLVQLGSKMGYGFGSEAASKTIRKDINKKLSVLAMPYLWDPKNSTAALSDLVTRNPQEFEAFAWMPLIVSAGSLSLGAIVFSQPLLTPVAIACLWLYKYVKKPFGWAIRQIYGGLFFESNIKIRKLSGEIFDSSPTIRAMGREPEFQLLTNDNFYRELQIGPLFMSAWGRTNFYACVIPVSYCLSRCAHAYCCCCGGGRGCVRV